MLSLVYHACLIAHSSPVNRVLGSLEPRFGGYECKSIVSPLSTLRYNA